MPVPLPNYPNRCASYYLLSDLREELEYANSKIMAEVLRSIGADDVNSGFGVSRRCRWRENGLR
jgi:hypothetical protein